jgi:hypothetical protein
MQYFCTYFDQNYLARALVLYDSLVRVGAPFTLWALCLDEETEQIVHRLDRPGLIPISLRDLEAADPEVAATAGNRTQIEYYFTLTPALALYLLDSRPEIDIISYVDADLCFYSDPQTVLDELAGGSVLIIPHGFPERLAGLLQYGRFNVGMVSFRNDPDGWSCLRHWRDQCIDWCYDRVEDGRFADQRYLDAWPSEWNRVVVLDRPGVGLGPWNFMRFAIDVSQTPPTVDGHPLVFYHFQAFKAVNGRVFDDGLTAYGPMPRSIRSALYGGYIRALRGEHTSAVGSVAATRREGSTMTVKRLLRLALRRRLLYRLGDRVLG